MGDFFGNLATLLGGVGGILVGFLLIALVFIAAFLPILFWWRQSGPTVRHTGLERFAASLNTPDEGYEDRIPPKVIAPSPRTRRPSTGAATDARTPTVHGIPPEGQSGPE